MSSNDTTDYTTLYRSFLRQPDPNISSILYSPTTNPTAYATVLRSHIRNRRFATAATPKPALIITPTTESHVQAAVLFAKKLGFHLIVRSGGHDYNGMSYVSQEKKFILLDMFNLQNVTVSLATETAVIEAGALLGTLYYRIWEKSNTHGFPAGVCLNVGAGGHISGGGYGTLMRKYGLSIDHVVDARIVDANGRILDRKSMGQDLFWAIRGGGAASFGVVLSYTVKLVPVPKINTVFRITKTVDQNAVDLVYIWQSVAPKLDRDLFIRVIIMPETTVNCRISVNTTFIAHFLGDSERLIKLMDKSFPELGVKKEDCLELSWIESALYWANYDPKTPVDLLLDRHSYKVDFCIRKCDYVQTPIPKSGWESIFTKLGEFGKCGLYLNPYGGMMEEIPADATPCPHRAGNLFKIQYWLNWSEDDPALDEKYLDQTRVLYEFMTDYVSKNPRCVFLNYRDLDIGVMVGTGKRGYKSGKVYGEKYFKGNFERLVKVKTAVDPENFFRNEQSIPTLPRIEKAGTGMGLLISRI